MKLSIIVAMARNRVIGRDGNLPWRLGADLQRFKRLTMGHPLIMGRKTFESIGRVLPGRTSIVVTRQAGYSRPGILIAHSLPEAVHMAAGSDEVFVIGGGELYEQALPMAERIYATYVETEPVGDTWFPALDESQWKAVEESWHTTDDRNEFASRFVVYDRLPDEKHSD